jgi:hypothetical protein
MGKGNNGNPNTPVTLPPVVVGNGVVTTVNPNTTTPTPTVGVCMVPTTKQTMVKRGNSTVPNPVGMVYVTCINHLWVLQGGIWVRTSNPVNRNTLHNLCYGIGVTYYTTRTQVQQYLKVSKLGTLNPTQHTLPKGVQPQG